MLAAIAGTLGVNIVARTQDFVKGIGKARKSLGGFGRQISSIGKGVVGFGSTMLGVAGVAGLAVFAKSTVDAAVKLGEISDKLGIATDSLELMRFAAEATGVSQTSLDTALQRMIRRVGQAAQGTGEAAKVLDRLGISAEELNQLDPAAQFTAIGDAITAIPDRGGKLAATMAIFDTEGVGLVNLMADGLNRYSTAFERAGGPTSTKGVKNAREFAFHAQQLKGAFGALGRDFILDATPQLLEAIRGMQTLLDAQSASRNRAATKFASNAARAGTIDPGKFTAGEKIGGFATGIAELAGNPADIFGPDRSPLSRSTRIQRDLEGRRRSVLSGGGDPGRRVDSETGLPGILSGVAARLDAIRDELKRQTKFQMSIQQTAPF